VIISSDERKPDPISLEQHRTNNNQRREIMVCRHTISYGNTFPALIIPDDNKGAIMAVIRRNPGQTGV
jgi:hypothetical protein